MCSVEKWCLSFAGLALQANWATFRTFQKAAWNAAHTRARAFVPGSSAATMRRTLGGLFASILLPAAFAQTYTPLPPSSTTAHGTVEYRLYGSSFPTEHYDGPGTNSAPNGGPNAIGNITSTSVTTNDGPLFFLSRQPSELYMVAGDPHHPGHISKVDPTTMANSKTTSLDCKFTGGPSNCPDNLAWYPSAVVHANGYIYVVSESRIWKLDSDLNLLYYYNLPITDGYYNSLKVLSDGNLVAKGFSNPFGNQVCSDGTPLCSSFTIVDPNLKTIVAEQVFPETSQARITDLVYNSIEYIFVVGETTLWRYVYNASANSITTLDSWFYTYRTSDSTDTPANPAIVIGNQAYFVDGMVPPGNAGPIHLYRVNLDNASDAQQFTPWPGTTHAFRLSKQLADPVNNVIVVSDSQNELVGGFRYLGDGVFRTLWSITSFQSTAVQSATSASRNLYIDDSSTGVTDIVILNILTGAELERLPTSAGPGNFFTVGSNHDVFFTGGNDSVRISSD